MLIVTQDLRRAFNIEMFEAIYIWGIDKGWHLMMKYKDNEKVYFINPTKAVQNDV